MKVGDTGRNGIMFTGTRGRIFVNRGVSTCHLGNIAMQLGRPLKWDPEKEQFIGDAEANGLLRREQRKGFEVV